MKTDSGDSVLEGAMRELIQAWSATSDGWHDDARTEVDRDHVEPICARTRHAARALAELSLLCGDAIRRCE